jgi:hypothetical protein
VLEVAGPIGPVMRFLAIQPHKAPWIYPLATSSMRAVGIEPTFTID